MEKLIITAAICGAEVTKEQNPAVPYTVEEIDAGEYEFVGIENATGELKPNGINTVPAIAKNKVKDPKEGWIDLIKLIQDNNLSKNNKFIVIDGGGVATSDNNSGYLYGYLQELTGQQVPEIEAWFLSHLQSCRILLCELCRYL